MALDFPNIHQIQSAQDSRQLADTVGAARKKPLSRPFPVDTSAALENLLRKYKKLEYPIPVSFRKLVPWLKMGERATHHIHPYPAKLIPQIAHFFLAAQDFAGQAKTVLDPFGGTGTVSLEAILAGKKAIYAEANPLAQLITRVKVTEFDLSALEQSLLIVKRKYSEIRKTTSSDVINVQHWYTKSCKHQLEKLKTAIQISVPLEQRPFFDITFSVASRKASLADPRLSVPVRMKDKTQRSRDASYGTKVMQIFERQFCENIKRYDELSRFTKRSPRLMFAGPDARSLQDTSTKRRMKSASVDLIITSPPYAGAQKYIRASSLSLGWLDLVSSKKLSALEANTIGREHLPASVWRVCHDTRIKSANSFIKKIFRINPKRAGIIAVYINDMEIAIREMCRVLKPKGKVVFVIGNNEVCGKPFRSSAFLKELFILNGMKIILELKDEIRSRGLMTKRNRAASVISREWVLVFEKP